ncbi:MAG: hypothetical protein ACLVCH_12115 [Roseburia inulinivorans]
MKICVIPVRIRPFYQLCSDKVQEETLETSGTAQLQWAVLQENQYRVPYTLEEYTQMIRDYMVKVSNDQRKAYHWYFDRRVPTGTGIPCYRTHPGI